MAITPPPVPPNSGDPANFNARADAFLGWFPAFVSQFNAELPYIKSKSWTTYGGSANAITLTGGFVSLVRGIQVRFRATAANTGAATINLDGLGAKPCRTVTGAVLPAGYIRTNADTTATYDGTNWVLDREIERGSNANGEYVRWPDGTMLVATIVYSLGPISTANGSVFRSGRYSWTFAASFTAIPSVQITGLRDNIDPPTIWVSLADGYLTGQNFWLLAPISASQTSFRASCLAFGRWY